MYETKNNVDCIAHNADVQRESSGKLLFFSRSLVRWTTVSTVSKVKQYRELGQYRIYGTDHL